MNPSIDILPGLKTYIAAAGLVGLALYQISQGDFAHAFQSIMGATAVFGVRNAVGRSEAINVAYQQEVLKRQQEIIVRQQELVRHFETLQYQLPLK